MGILRTIISLVEIVFVAYWIVPLLYPRIKEQKAYQWVDQLLAPLLTFIRKQTDKFIPEKFRVIDWSYVVVIILIALIRLLI
ncbi:MAG: YggT family protein [Clostridia bacterium]|nr:YggT family protein [Clostridia bacterium]